MAQQQRSSFLAARVASSLRRAAAAQPGDRRRDVWIALLVLGWLAATAWARPLMLPDEGRYVGVAWEMMRSGDWSTPTLNGLPYFHKPPLFYWITAGAMSLFGTSEWSARAAPLLGGWIGALALYFFVRRWAGRRRARLALVALLAQPLFFAGAQFANLDMLVAGFITLAIVLAAHAALCVEHALPHRRALLGACAAAAFGVLAKGLIGVVLPVLVVGSWLIARRRWHVLRALLWWPGLVLFVLLAAPWFVAMQTRFAGFFDYFFIVQHFHRFASGGFNNAQPFWFYGALLLGFSAPWLPWLARTPLLRRSGYVDDSQRGALRLLMLLWLLVVVLFFSLPASKLVGYVLPALPPLAFLIAEGFARLATPSARERRLWAAGTGVGAALGLAAALWLTVFPTPSSRTLALALAAQRHAGEPIIMLHEYAFDLPFYARLAEPVRIVDAWGSPEVQRFDNWRKELADAARFNEKRAAATLLTPESLASALCGAGVSWLIGAPRLTGHYTYLALLRPVAIGRHLMLWRLDTNVPAIADVLRCAAQPPAPEPAGALL